MMIQRHSDSLCDRIQLKTGQIRQEQLRHGNRVHVGFRSGEPLLPAGLDDKTHIKIRVVRNHDRAPAERKELRQHMVNRRRVQDHLVIDGRQFLNSVGNRLLRIYKCGKPVCYFPVFYPYCSDLNDFTGQIGQSRGLYIKHHIGIIQTLAAAVRCDSLQIVNQIRFHPVKHLKRSRNLFQFLLRYIRMLRLVFFPVGVINVLHGMVCLRKGLHHAVIRDGNGRHSPPVRLFHQPGGIRDPVHVAHFGVTVQFHSLHRSVIVSSLTEIRRLQDPLNPGHGQLVLPVVHLHTPLHADKGSLGKSILRLLLL